MPEYAGYVLFIVAVVACLCYVANALETEDIRRKQPPGGSGEDWPNFDGHNVFSLGCKLIKIRRIDFPRQLEGTSLFAIVVSEWFYGLA
jgi:hypothetical protein